MRTFLDLSGEHFPKTNPIGSMYGIFTYVYHKNQPVGKYTSLMDTMGIGNDHLVILRSEQSATPTIDINLITLHPLGSHQQLSARLGGIMVAYSTVNKALFSLALGW